jgi:dGTPase
LNLTWEVREGLCKHRPEELEVGNHPSLEAQVADLADEIAYCSSDLDDAIDSGLIDPEKLQEIELWKLIEEDVNRNYSQLEFSRRRRYIIRCLINLLVEDCCRESARLIDEGEIQSADDARTHSRRLIGFTIKMRARVQNLRDFLYQKFLLPRGCQ